MNHQRHRVAGSLVGVARIKRRRRVVLNPKLDRLCHFCPGQFGDEAEGEVDSRRNSGRGKDRAVTYHTGPFVAGTHQWQQIDKGPKGCRPSPCQQASGPQKKRTPANRCDIARLRTLLANEIYRLGVG